MTQPVLKGVVYTPPFWADWAVKYFQLAEKWLAGARVLDPGCGQGALTLALLRRAVSLGVHPGPGPLGRLRCLDMDAGALETFRDKVLDEFDVDIPEGMLVVDDFLDTSYSHTADIVLGNPPWVSFGDLDEPRKERYKPIFRRSGIIPNGRDLLLGGSRVDLAALFVATALRRDLLPGGTAYFFLPLSLYQSEGAHRGFRLLELPGGGTFALDAVYNLPDGPAFPGAGTRCCLAVYRSGVSQTWPIPWHTAGGSGTETFRSGRIIWTRQKAAPVAEPGSSLLPLPEDAPEFSPPVVHVPHETLPRQGVNPCGTAEVFLVEKLDADAADGVVAVRNRKGVTGRLPSELLHPSMDGRCFRTGTGTTPADVPIDLQNYTPERWIFMPYGQNGKLLSEADLTAYPGVSDWLSLHREKLENRKGVLIRKLRTEGCWWGLLGVGPYAFAPWKVAWESYGRGHFLPRLFNCTGPWCWQGNQALHAYLPFQSKEAALTALKDLLQPEVAVYLKHLGGAETKYWAQPGRIRRLLSSPPGSCH